MRLLFLLLSFTYNLALAQEQTPTSGGGAMALSVYAGPLLPNNIDGVTEIQSSWGARLAKVAEWADFYEIGFLISNSEGVEIFDYYFSAKKEVETDAFLTQLYAGLDYFTYKSNAGDDDKVFGLHAGSAILIHVSQSLLFRTDMRFNYKPGNILFIGFGLETRF